VTFLNISTSKYDQNSRKCVWMLDQYKGFSFSLEVFLLVCEFNGFIQFSYVVSKETKYMFPTFLLFSSILC